MDRLKTTLESTDSKEIRQALQLLHEDYEQRGGGFYLREVAGGWQLRSRPQYHEWIRRLLQPSPQRLSKAALETLAIIAYKQPIIRADIEFIRGVDCGGVLRQLMERKLIRVLGRKEIAGRPLIYATTKLFLELFDLKDLKDLPSPKEIAELTNDRPSDSDQGAEDPAEISETASGRESDLENEPEELADGSSEGSVANQDQLLDTNTQSQSDENERAEDHEIPDSNNTLNPDRQVDDKDIRLNNA